MIWRGSGSKRWKNSSNFFEPHVIWKLLGQLWRYGPGCRWKTLCGRVVQANGLALRNVIFAATEMEQGRFLVLELGRRCLLLMLPPKPMRTPVCPADRINGTVIQSVSKVCNHRSRVP